MQSRFRFCALIGIIVVTSVGIFLKIQLVRNDRAATAVLSHTKISNAITELPKKFIFDGAITEWSSATAPTTLLTATNKPVGAAWVAQYKEGLVVSGYVLGVRAHWSTTSTDDKDYFAISIGDTDNVQLPPIGWGNQFGDSEYTSEHDCLSDKPQPFSESKTNALNMSACKMWFEKQAAYRETFKELFGRTWEITPRGAVETDAHDAWNLIVTSTQKVITELEPNAAAPVVKINEQPFAGAVYSFEVLLPWSLFPPQDRLTVSGVALDILGAQGDKEFESLVEPGTYLALPKPLEFHLGACNASFDDAYYTNHGTEAYAANNTNGVPYFFMSDTPGVIDQLLFIDNPRSTHAYGGDDVSPIINTADFFSTTTPNGGNLCGPKLTYAKDAVRISSDFIVNNFSSVRTLQLDAKSVLAIEEPWTFNNFFTNGACGACTQMTANVYRFDLEKHSAKQIFNFWEEANTIVDMDVLISHDAHKITTFTTEDAKQPQKWDVKEFCLNRPATTYTMCHIPGGAVPLPADHVPLFFDGDS